MRFRGSEGGASAAPGSETPRLPAEDGVLEREAEAISAGSAAPLEPEEPPFLQTPVARISLQVRREPLFFVVIILLVLDILLGLGIAVFAEKILEFRPMAVMGIGLAILGVGILAYFVLLGDGSTRGIEKKRRAALQRERERSAS